MRLNPAATIWVEQVGDFPVLYIDDAYADPDAVRDQALGADYAVAAAYYPGLHAPIDTPECRAVAGQLCALLRSLGPVRFEPPDVVADFSVITTPPERLLAQQQHPHIDPNPLFALVYLTPGMTTSTSFYRNRTTGLHRIVTPQDHAAHAAFVERFGGIRASGGYDLSAHPHWERLHSIEGRFNRLVCYPGNVFHAVDPGPVPQPFDIRRARITQRFAFIRATAGPQPA